MRFLSDAGRETFGCRVCLAAVRNSLGAIEVEQFGTRAEVAAHIASVHEPLPGATPRFGATPILAP